MQTQHGVYYWISHSLIIDNLPLLGIKSKQGIIKRIDKLVDAGLLVKNPGCAQSGKSLYAFGPNYDKITFSVNENSVDTPIQNYRGSLSENIGGPLYENIGDNIYNNYNSDNIINNGENEFSQPAQTNIQPKLRGTTEAKKCLFANSRFAKFEDFAKCFDKPEFANIDIGYYYHSVADWSASKGKMQNDWIATARNFIRGDKERGKLHLLTQPDKKDYIPMLGMGKEDAIKILNDDFD